MIVVVPVDPPQTEFVPRSLVDESPLGESEALDLYEAAVRDVVRSVIASGGDLLINYRDGDTLPESSVDADPEADWRELLAPTIDDAETIRFEPQVGSTPSARIGNTVAHLLDQEGAASVGVLQPTAALVQRTHIDGAAMSVRRHEVVLGPDGTGSVYFAAFTEPVDFEDAYHEPALSRLASRAEDRDHSIGFAPTIPTIEDPAGLAGTIAAIEAYRSASRSLPEATAAVIDDLGLTVDDTGSVVLR